jgi:phospholipid/cholesterol/gamma-HCH transport system ATP-binding protein
MTGDASAPYFAVNGLSKGWSGCAVLRDISFTVPRGETLVVLGGSGAGKSVLLKHLNGLHAPDSGSVAISGIPLDDMSQAELARQRRRIGMLFQHGALFDSMSLGENVAFPLRETGLRDEAEIGRRVAEVLGRVGLAEEERKNPALLSGGMVKRVALARALVANPAALLCDEPTAGLDPILTVAIVELIHRCQRELGLTCVVVTHHLGAMRKLADQVLFLDKGEVRFLGTPQELELSEDPRIQEFLEADR